MQAPITRGIARVIGEALGEHYFSHRLIEARCAESGIRTDPPDGMNCSDKLTYLITEEAKARPAEIASIVGQLLQEYMDGESYRCPGGKEKIHRVLGDNGLAYVQGGFIHGAGTSMPTRSLDEMLRQRSLPEIEKEFQRALESVEKDPPAAITAACAILESFCRVYLQQAGITPPGDQTAKSLWKVVAEHLGLASCKVLSSYLILAPTRRHSRNWMRLRFAGGVSPFLVFVAILSPQTLRCGKVLWGTARTAETVFRCGCWRAMSLHAAETAITTGGVTRVLVVGRGLSEKTRRKRCDSVDFQVREESTFALVMMASKTKSNPHLSLALCAWHQTTVLIACHRRRESVRCAGWSKDLFGIRKNSGVL